VDLKNKSMNHCICKCVYLYEDDFKKLRKTMSYEDVQKKTLAGGACRACLNEESSKLTKTMFKAEQEIKKFRSSKC
jgi:hypothetical protein